MESNWTERGEFLYSPWFIRISSLRVPSLAECTCTIIEKPILAHDYHPESIIH